jgi:hypothetical protein
MNPTPTLKMLPKDFGGFGNGFLPKAELINMPAKLQDVCRDRCEVLIVEIV